MTSRSEESHIERQQMPASAKHRGANMGVVRMVRSTDRARRFESLSAMGLSDAAKPLSGRRLSVAVGPQADFRRATLA
eukprot:3784957-Pleurochrysis_carterae.AAC.1